MKLGNRVTVLSGPFKGKRGEVAQIGAAPGVSGEHATCPPGCENKVLVDDQLVNGQRVGSCTMREWFDPSELEVG